MQSVVVLVLVLVVVAQVWADDDHGCGPAERFGVAMDWADIYSTGKERQKFGTHLFQKFLEYYPDARITFQRVCGDNIQSSEFQAHIACVMSGLNMAVSLLHEKPVLKQHIEHINHQHQAMDIPDKYFVTFGEVFLDALPRFLGYHPHIDAWKHCYDMFVEGITAKTP